MRLMKRHLWELAIHSPKYWNETLRDKNEPPVIPYFAYKRKMPYDLFERNGQKYQAIGTYFFPFAIRHFEKVKEC